MNLSVENVNMEDWTLTPVADTDNPDQEVENSLFPADEMLPIDTYWQYGAYIHMFKIIPPILMIVGTIGNTLTLVVMHSKAFRSVPSSLILSALAVADTGVLLTGLLRQWIRMISNFSVDIRLGSSAGCKIHVFLTYFFAHLAPWYLVLLTIERSISVFFPLRCREICSRKKMAITVGTITVMLIGINLHHFITSDRRILTAHITSTQVYSYAACYNLEKFESFHRGAWYWIDSTLASIGPFIIILIGNIIIMVKLTIAQHQRQDQMQVSNKDGSKMNSTTLILIVVSTCFLLLTMPSAIYYIRLDLLSLDFRLMTNYAKAKLSFANSMTTLLFFANSAINFFLYCLSGTKFRSALLSVVFCHEEKKKPQITPPIKQPVPGTQPNVAVTQSSGTQMTPLPTDTPTD